MSANITSGGVLHAVRSICFPSLARSCRTLCLVFALVLFAGSAVGAAASGEAPAKWAVLHCANSSRELGQLSVACANSSGLISDVVYADYGKPHPRAPAEGPCAIERTPSCSFDIKTHVLGKCDGKSSCTLDVGNDAFGFDPCPEKTKWTAVG